MTTPVDARDSLCSDDDAEALGAPVHRDVAAHLRALQREAQDAGFDLRVFSGFRGFEQQLSIWNRKVGGELAVLDSNAVPIDIERLDDRALMFAILRWSALPGTSRHHWGTEVDVFDAAARPEGYEIELIPEEVEGDGMFAPMHDWIDQRMSLGQAHGFFRPYDRDRGGVAPERWHLSHRPVAIRYEEAWTTDALRAVLANSDIALKATVLEHLDEIWSRYVININRPT
ncbi:MAG: M15 family metallopeptidase [Gemmatimonadota bacterium]